MYNSSVCGIITVNNTGKLTNCTVNMNIIVNGEGNINCGAITANNSGYITYCSADGSISGVCSSGTVGFISASSSNHIYKCCGTGIIKLSSSSSVCAGGITGSYSHKLTNSTDIGISECFSSVDIDLNDCSSCIIGGIVGICNYYDEVYTYRASEGYGPYERVVTKTGHIYHTTNIDNCYNSGTLLGTGKVAGIVATKGCGIQQCINFSDGRIFDNDLEHTGNISNVYCKSGSKFGLGGTPLTEPLMKQQASYLGLDFTNTWEMFNGRPRLKNNPENFVTQINFSKRPTKLTFYQGDELVTDGSLEVTYSDNTVRNVNITTIMNP